MSIQRQFKFKKEKKNLKILHSYNYKVLLHSNLSEKSTQFRCSILIKYDLILVSPSRLYLSKESNMTSETQFIPG